jgi:hypothetical protein
MTNTIELTLKTIEGDEIILEVYGKYYPAIRGSRDRWGAPEEPDEDESWEVLDISYKGKSITDDEIEIMTGVNDDELYSLIENKFKEEDEQF